MDQIGTFHDTESGTPQGGVISPLLANIALDGMEEYLVPGTNRTVVRYADDFVVLTRTHRDAEKAYVEVSKWLSKRGLKLNDQKTRVVELPDGFDFLGFNVRLYDETPHRPRETKRWKLLIKPSDDAVKRLKARLRAEWRKGVAKKLDELIPRLNQIIRGLLSCPRPRGPRTPAYPAMTSRLKSV